MTVDTTKEATMCAERERHIRDIDLLIDDLRDRERKAGMGEAITLFQFQQTLRHVRSILSGEFQWDRELPVVDQFKKFIASLDGKSKRALELYIENCIEYDNPRIYL